MSVANGQIANATTFNDAFLSKQAGGDTQGVISLSEVSSGGVITNAQQKINDTATQAATALADAATAIAALPGKVNTTDVINVAHGGTNAITAPLARESLGTQKKKNGLVSKSLFTLSYRADTRTLTVTYGAGAIVWVNGVSYAKAGSESLSHNITNGKQFYYYDITGTLVVSASVAWNLLTTAPLALVYYKHNATPALAKGVLLEERHPGGDDGFDEADHRWKHLYIGTQLNGFPVISAYTLNSAANIPYAVTSTIVEDEDSFTTIAAMPDNGPYPMLWVDNASGTWDWDFTTSTNGLSMGGGNMQWNNTATGALTSVTTNGRYINMWPIALPILGYSLGSAFTAYSGFITIVGQAEYTSLALAQAVTPSNLLMLTNFTEEGVVYARVTYTRVTGSPQIPVDPVYYKGNITNISSTSFVPTDHQVLSNRSATNSHPATAVSVDTTLFATNLASTDDTVQKCLDKIDDLILGSGGSFTTQAFSGTTISITASGFQRWRYTGSSTQTLTAFTLTSAIDASVINILGTSDTNTISIPTTATGISRMNGDIELGLGQIISFQYDSTIGGLCEVSRS